MSESVESRLAHEIAERRHGRPVTASDLANRLMPWLASELRKAKAEAWEEGVATALNHAKCWSDGITLKLVTFDGDAWQNPYRADELEGEKK